MLLVVSRFRVVNGMEGDVTKAFLGRPHLVESAPGFLGMEVFCSGDDPAAFWLVTRWTDDQSFETWYHSKSHQASHRWIPKGLKVDPASTGLIKLHRIEHPTSEVDDQYQASLDAADLISNFIFHHAQHTFFVTFNADGRISRASEPLCVYLGKSQSDVVGSLISSHVTDPDALKLFDIIAGKEPAPRGPLLLSFVSADHSPFSVSCLSSRSPNGDIVLLGELQYGPGIEEELLRTNNDMAVLQRDMVKKNRELSTQNRHARQIAEQDTLTEVANRLSLDRYLPGVLARATREEPVSVLMVDIDHFKRVNDTYGHPAGDAVLKSFARYLQSCVRPSDFVARYGGEEFLIVLPGACRDIAMPIAERLRAGLAHYIMPAIPETVTASVGATCAHEREKADSLLSRVDAALYIAKNEGRNCVRWADTPPLTAVIPHPASDGGKP